MQYNSFQKAGIENNTIHIIAYWIGCSVGWSWLVVVKESSPVVWKLAT
jgi:hypothetical protein